MKNIIIILLVFWSNLIYGLTFDLPKNGNNLIGEPIIAKVIYNEDFSDIASRFGVGYYEVLEANPGIDPDEPPTDIVLIIPTQYILPRELTEKKNIIVVNIAEMRLYYQQENKIYIYPVGVGRKGWDTPLGIMTVVRKVKNPTWHVPDSIYKFRQTMGLKVNKIVPPGPDNPLGKHALYLSVEGNMIHGTNTNYGIGKRSSAGCLRLYENDIAELYNLVTIGTKVVIINRPYKADWIDGKLYLEAHMPLSEQRLKLDNDTKPALDIVTKIANTHNVVVDWQKVDMVTKEHLVVPRVVSLESNG
ncbi:MAG: L,D-transpeptidase family protein [Coxiellaceae bacterium]|jgi:L,D-transpeptidase ErfK/SrfK|nr:L,D-transpeptidase family protein [Coxiellaceae bacterium]